MQDTSPPHTGHDDFQMLRYIRWEKFNEHNLLAHRISWLLTTEAFLIGAAFAVFAGQYRLWLWLAGIVVPIFGIIVALIARIPIEAALDTVDYWDIRERRYYVGPFSFWTLGDRAPHIHRQSMRLARSLPWIFIALWLLLAVGSATFLLLTASGRLS